MGISKNSKNFRQYPKMLSFSIVNECEQLYYIQRIYIWKLEQGWGSNIFNPDPAHLENPDPTLNRNEEKNIFIF